MIMSRFTPDYLEGAIVQISSYQLSSVSYYDKAWGAGGLFLETLFCLFVIDVYTDNKEAKYYADYYSVYAPK